MKLDDQTEARALDTKRRSQRQSALLCLLLAGIYLSLAPFPKGLASSLFGYPSSPVQQSRVVNVAIYDSFHEHYEIIGPLIYALARLPNIRLSVYRDHWLYEYPDLLQPRFAGPFHKVLTFYQAPANATSADNVDILFLPNADLDLRDMLQRRVDQHPQLRKAKIVAGVHRTEQWEAAPVGAKVRPDSRPVEWTNSFAGQEIIRKAVKERRLSFLTYSPHVATEFRKIARRNGMGRQTKIESFVPVVPDIAGRGSGRDEGGETCRKAVVQGSFNGDRDYARIFAELEKAIRSDPIAWGYEMQETPARLVDVGLKVGSEPSGFQLHLLGHIKHHDRVDSGPAFLEPVIKVQPNLQYKDYYRTISEMDMLLPAWVPDTPYVKTRSSSSIPAAIMARIPALLSAQEAQAYSYASGPAVLVRQSGESEVEAIARLRATTGCRSVGVSEWQQYEKSLVERNEGILHQLMR